MRTSKVKELTLTVRVTWNDGIGVKQARKALSGCVLKERIRCALGEELDGPKQLPDYKHIAGVTIKVRVQP